MPVKKYNGSITNTIYSSATVINKNSMALNFLNSQISWNQNTDPQLVGLTLSELLKNHFFEITYSVNIQITGTQYYDDSSFPTSDISLFLSDGMSSNESYTANSPGSIGYGSYNVNDNISLPTYPINIDVNVHNRCHSGLPGCITYNATNYSLILILNIEVTADCTGKNLDNVFCSNYCLTNVPECINSYLEYCLPPNSTNLPITNSQSCQNFISNYIQNQGPLAQIDDTLAYYCNNKYKGFGDLFSSNNALDQSLCACHMPADQYTNFEGQLVKLYPGFGNLGVVDECLLPQCASSQYKSVVTTAKCNLPQCINIATFNNDGTFDNSSVTINQTGKCANIVTPTSPTGPSPSGPPTNSKYIIIGLISLIVLIIIIILIYYIIETSKK